MHSDGSGCCATDRRGFMRDTAIALAAFCAAGASAIRAEQLAMREETGRDAGETRLTFSVPPDDGVTVDREHNVLLTRWQGKVYAFSMICPHQRAAVKWVEGAGHFQCTKHKSKYSQDGAYVSGRATRSLDRFSIRHDGGALLVDTDALYKQDKDAAQWGSAFVQL